VAYDLDALIAGIAPGNLHDEVSFGKPVGQESL
jgi:antitoxin component of MazEF toxin-antitoxin module